MKKFLLLAAVAIGMSYANATTVTWTPGELSYGNADVIENVTIGEVTLALSIGEGSNAPAYYTSDATLRVYKKNTLTFTCDQPINSVVFTTSSKYPFDSNSTVDTGELAIESTSTIWTGYAEEFTLTNGPDQNVRIEAITVTYGEEEATDLLYTATAKYVQYYEDWAIAPMAGQETTVDVYPDHIVVNNVANGQLGIYFDESDLVINITYTADGKTTTYGDGDGEYFYTDWLYGDFGEYDGAPAECMYLLGGEWYGYGYGYAGHDDEGGYIAILGEYYTFTTNEYLGMDEDTWGEFSLEWEAPQPEQPLYTATAVGVQYDGWAENPAVDETYSVDVYDGHVDINFTTGVVLSVYYDPETEVVTSLTATEDGESSTSEAGNSYVYSDWIYGNYGDYDNFMALIGSYKTSTYAYAGEEDGEGYVVLCGYYWDWDANDSVWGTFAIEWANSSSGINSAAAELPSMSEAVYYNLQGVKVANPQAGKVYIRVADGKASKIVK